VSAMPRKINRSVPLYTFWIKTQCQSWCEVEVWKHFSDSRTRGAHRGRRFDLIFDHAINELMTRLFAPQTSSLSVQKQAWQLINGKTSKLARDIKFTLRRTSLRGSDQLLRKVAEAIQQSVIVGMSAIQAELLDRSSQQDSANLVSQGGIAALYEHVHQRKILL
jgi:hypothetical protein